MSWGFYGRESELTYLKDVLSRDRWFFVKVIGRRRIGKTALIQQALTASGGRPVYYVQIPDSGPVGVLSAAVDAMGTFGVDPGKFKHPTSMSEFAKFIAALARAAMSSHWTSSSTSTERGFATSAPCSSARSTHSHRRPPR